MGSLTRTLFLGFVFVFILMSALVSLYGRSVLRSITNEKLDYILLTQADNAAQLLWDFDIEKLKTSLKNIVRDKNIAAARVYEVVGDSRTVVEQYGWNNISDTSVVYSHDIIYVNNSGESKALGALEVVVDYSSVENQIFDIVRINAVVFGSIFILLCAIVYYLLRCAIGPVTRLSESLVSADYFTHTIQKDKRVTREINDLFDALINMQNIMQQQTRNFQDQKVMLDTIIDSMPLGVLVEDVSGEHGTTILVNNMFTKLFKLDDAFFDLQGLASLLPLEVAGLMEGFNNRILKGEDSVSEEIPIQFYGREDFIAYIIKAPVKNNDGDVSLIVSLVKDVTGEVQVRDNLMEAKDTAERASQAKSEFLANMSHELRTPMNSIIGLTEMMVEDGDSTPEKQEMLSTVLKSSNMLLEIVNDILDLSKIEEGGVVLEGVPFEVRSSVDDVLEALKSLSSAAGVTLTSVWQSDLSPVVDGDPIRVARIINNLVSNALKFTHEGSVEVKLDIRPQDDDVFMLSCAVHDTGIGIPEEKIEHIFEKFAQADDSTTRKFGGTGLGLAITKQLVEMMGGNISVTSEVDEGSVFSVNIPFKLHKTKEGAVFVDKSGDGEVGNDIKPSIDEIRVLVAEDQPLNQMMVRKLLEKVGVQDFDIAEDGGEAVQFYTEVVYDLVIMDCHMPNMDGYAATREIRELECRLGREAVPILAMTADAMVGTRDECLKVGMSDYISKPVKIKDFSCILRQWFTGL